MQTSVGASCPIRLISLSHRVRSIIATELTGPLTALAAAMWFPSGDQEHRRKYVVSGELLNGELMVASRTKLFTMSCCVALGAGGVNRKILMVRSLEQVASFRP